MAKKNNAKSAAGGNAAAKTEKKGKNQISQQQARANAARASAKISPAPEGPGACYFGAGAHLQFRAVLGAGA